MRHSVARHIVTCLFCGFREATNPWNSYAEQCPNEGGPLEHLVTAITTREEMAEVARAGQDSRRPTHSFTVRQAT